MWWQHVVYPSVQGMERDLGITYEGEGWYGNKLVVRYDDKFEVFLWTQEDPRELLMKLANLPRREKKDETVTDSAS